MKTQIFFILNMLHSLIMHDSSLPKHDFSYTYSVNLIARKKIFRCLFQVIIAGLYGTELNQTVSFDRPVKSVGIDPFFSKQGRGRQFVIGEEKV